MTLPGNEYTRVCARLAGRLRAKLATCGGTRLVRNGVAEGWVIDDGHGYYERLEHAETEVYRWRASWWCSENAGVRIMKGGLTVKALAMHALWLAALPATIIAVGSGVLAVMWIGAMVLR